MNLLNPNFLELKKLRELAQVKSIIKFVGLVTANKT